MTTPNKNDLSLVAATIHDLLWAAESLYEDLSFPGDKYQLQQHSAGLACIRSAQKMANKLAADIDALPKG